MKTLYLFALVVFVMVAPAFAQADQKQKPCAAKELPAVRGFKIGMTAEAVKALTGKQPAKADETGEQRLIIAPESLPVADRANLEKVTLDFFDGQIWRIGIQYRFSDVRFDSGAEFAAAVGKSLGLDCQFVDSECACGTLKVLAVASGATGLLIISDTEAQSKIAERQKRANDEKKKVFKP